jgi:multicomponent Na+:H+ antiporter subunit B
MRKLVALIPLGVIAAGLVLALAEIPFGSPKGEVGRYYLREGREQTGAVNIVTSVVVGYRGFDTLGEVTILFAAAVGIGAVLKFAGKNARPAGYRPSSVILRTGCRFLFPVILLVGAYIFLHGHLTPGGGFPGGAVMASAFLLIYLGCRERRISERIGGTVESSAGLVFVLTGLAGLAVGGYFLADFLPRGTPGELFSAGIIPIIYLAIGLKVGAELAGIIDNLIEESG